MGNIFGRSPANQPKKTRTHINTDNKIQYSDHPFVQNFVLIWLDANFDESQADYKYAVAQLKTFVNSLHLYKDIDTCLQFIQTIQSEQIFLITSGALGKTFVPIIHRYPQVNSIYIFCGNQKVHGWTIEWKKISLVSEQIEFICKQIVRDAEQCEYDSTPTSLLVLKESTDEDFNQVNQSFMYSLLAKEILLEMDYQPQALQILVDFCREKYRENPKELQAIEDLEKNYHQHSPIWWYTRDCFLYQMLNHSLRIVDIELIAIMGFFMKDVHQQIKELHSTKSNQMGKFTVYRGQRMLKDDFDQLRKTIRGLFSFNSFLSTTLEKSVAMNFAKRQKNQTDRIAIIFEMEIHPSLVTTPFANLMEISCYQAKEKEILFSMHTVFRIQEIIENKHDQIWEVRLTSISETDIQIKQLTDHIRRQIGGRNATDRLGRLMIVLGEVRKAEMIYEYLISSPSTCDEKTYAYFHNQFGYIKYKQGDSLKAQPHLEKAMQIQEKLRPETDLDLANTYNNLGLLYTSLNDPSQALAYHLKALEIQEKKLDQNHTDLATTYNNIGLVYYHQGKCANALTYYNKTLSIYKKILPEDHPYLATTYKNIGLAQIATGQDATGLDNLFKAREIRKRSLPANHLSIASICSTIADEYTARKEYSMAMKYYQEALEIEKQADHSNTPSLAITYHCLSKVSRCLKQYREAIDYAKLAVQSAASSLKSDHPDTIMFRANLEELQRNFS